MWYSTCYPANNGDTSQSLHHRFFSHKITNTIISVSWRTPCSYFSWRDSTIITAEHGDIHWRLILSMLGRYVSTVYIHPVKTLWVIDLPVVQLKSHTQLIEFNAVWLPRFNSDRVLFHNKCFCSCKYYNDGGTAERFSPHPSRSLPLYVCQILFTSYRASIWASR